MLPCSMRRAGLRGAARRCALVVGATLVGHSYPLDARRYTRRKMTTTQSGPASAEGVSSGVLGGRPLIARTFRGSDPDTVAAAAICSVTPTKCQARTRLYRDGALEREGFPIAEIS